MISEEMARVENRLKEMGKSKSEFAIALGAPEANASAYYNNWRNRGLPKSRLKAAAEFLGTTIEWITDGQQHFSVLFIRADTQASLESHLKELSKKGYILACCSHDDRRFCILARRESNQNIETVVVTRPGGISAATIRILIELHILSRRIQLSSLEFANISDVDCEMTASDINGEGGLWSRIQIITHDSIYTPEVRDLWGNGSLLPGQMGRIMELYEAEKLDLDDLILLETIALRLAAKTKE